MKFPNEKVLNNLVNVFLRLQHTYQLNTSALANDIIESKNVGKQLSGKHCFNIGLIAYNNKKIFYALE